MLCCVLGIWGHIFCYCWIVFTFFFCLIVFLFWIAVVWMNLHHSLKDFNIIDLFMVVFIHGLMVNLEFFQNLTLFLLPCCVLFIGLPDALNHLDLLSDTPPFQSGVFSWIFSCLVAYLILWSSFFCLRADVILKADWGDMNW